MSGVIQQFPVEKEYEKNSDISPDDIRKLREWLMSQPHLPGAYWSDLYLILTYHCCDQSAEVTKQVLDVHVSARTLLTSFFKDRVVDKMVIDTMKAVVMSGVIQQFPVEKEYEKNPDISPDDIRKLREWLMSQPHLPGAYWSDLYLILTYHCCDQSAEVTKQVLDVHVSARTLLTSFFKDRVVDKMVIDTMKVVFHIPLALPTVHGYQALYCGLLDGDARKYNFTNVIRVAMMIIDLLQYEQGTWPGFVLIIDMHLANMGHIAKLEVVQLRQVVNFLQECMLLKLKEVHFCNAPPFMDKLMLLLKPFIKKSLLDMVHIHEADSEVFYKYVPKESLPKECGGNYKDLKTLCSENIRRIENNKDFFKQDKMWLVNESLRTNGKRTTAEDIFGIQGSFKKLDID